MKIDSKETRQNLKKFVLSLLKEGLKYAEIKRRVKQKYDQDLSSSTISTWKSKYGKKQKDIYFLIEEEENEIIRKTMKELGYKNLGAYFSDASTLFKEITKLMNLSGEEFNFESLLQTTKEAFSTHTDVLKFKKKDYHNLVIQPLKNIKGFLEILKQSFTLFIKENDLEQTKKALKITGYIQTILDIHEKLLLSMNKHFGTSITKIKKVPIVIIDDNKDFRELLVDQFALYNHEAIAFEDPKTAYLEMSKYKPDLILIDVNLRGKVTGIEFCRSLSQEQAFSQIPKFLITNLEGPKDLLLKDSGAIDVIFKPLLDNDLCRLCEYLK
ncbi:MAG: PleD family two-component system response regulator [Promethearchaeota archaeon]